MSTVSTEVQRWSDDDWASYDAFENDKRNWGEGWIYNTSGDSDNACPKCHSLNTRWEEHHDCFDKNYTGTISECLECGFVEVLS